MGLYNQCTQNAKYFKYTTTVPSADVVGYQARNTILTQSSV